MASWQSTYIPRQFKQLHDRELQELTKPLQAAGLPLGQTVESGMLSIEKTLSLTSAMRRANPHILILDVSSRKKRLLMSRMIAHDVSSKHGAVVLFDSTGDLANRLVQWASTQPTASGFAERIVQLDLSQSCDPLRLSDQWESGASATPIVGAIKRVGAPESLVPWAEEQTTKILRNAVLLLLTVTGSLDGLPALLQDSKFRASVIAQLESSTKSKAGHALVRAWEHYDRLSKTEQWIVWTEPILLRAEALLQDIHNLPAPLLGGDDLKRMLAERKILVLKGTNDSAFDFLFGSCLMLQIRSTVSELANQCPNVSIYLDEFDRFIDENVFSEVADTSGKPCIGLTYATSTLQVLPEAFRNSVVINSGTIAAFSLAKKDAVYLGSMFFRCDGRSKLTIEEQESLNSDRLIGQELDTFYCYRTGTVAGVFQLRVDGVDRT